MQTKRKTKSQKTGPIWGGQILTLRQYQVDPAGGSTEWLSVLSAFVCTGDWTLDLCRIVKYSNTANHKAGFYILAVP